jgi:hypothetical protein
VPLRQFIWQPPNSSFTRTGEAFDDLVAGIRRISDSADTQTLLQLLDNPAYLDVMRQSFLIGAKDGAVWARNTWKSEYAEVLSKVVQGLGNCVPDPSFLRALTAAAISEYFLTPTGQASAQGKSGYSDVLQCLSGSHSHDAGQPPALSGDDLDAQQAAQWLYNVGNFVDELGLIDMAKLADAGAANWVQSQRAELDEIVGVLLEKNGDPCGQGYFVGWYVAALAVNTVRSIVETGIELQSPY